MDFVIDRSIDMIFIVKPNAMPIYINNISMNNKIKINSSMNYYRYRRLEEYKTVTLATLKDRTLDDLSIERG